MMNKLYKVFIMIIVLLSGSFLARAEVKLTLGDETRTREFEGEKVRNTVTLENEHVRFMLKYEVIYPSAESNVVIPVYDQHPVIMIGMLTPSMANWYWHGFIRWTFDNESLHIRPAQMNIIRDSGSDAMLEYVWDTQEVKASLKFALISGSDKLLLFGDYESKGNPFENVRMTLYCYPATFEAPRNRRVTTVLGTTGPGEAKHLDMSKERWVLYEDITESRPGNGPAGLLIGTPDSFENVNFSIGSNLVRTFLDIDPERKSFALGFYDNPRFPEYTAVRKHFNKNGDSEAKQIGNMAQGDLSKPLSPMTVQR